MVRHRRTTEAEPSEWQMVYPRRQRHAHHLLAQGLQSDAQFQVQLHLIHPIRQQTEIALNAPWSVIASRASSPPRP